MGENNFAPWPTTIYGTVLLMASLAYFILQNIIIRTQREHSSLKKSIGKDWKGKASLICYITRVSVALIWPWAAHTLYVILAIMWLKPDRRIERVLNIK